MKSKIDEITNSLKGLCLPIIDKNLLYIPNTTLERTNMSLTLTDLAKHNANPISIEK